METVATGKALQETIDLLKGSNKEHNIGFVPTMGALHKGHLSLVKACKAICDICVVSIFVNPTQFNDKSDLDNYPRMPKQDLSLLEKEGTDIVFMPSVGEMYPTKDNRSFNFGALEVVMEGKHRPGHFNGVAQIVSKLFDAVLPNKAFFGEKDFQQLAIIKALVNLQAYKIDIVPCPTVREEDGLAMSSRNMRLIDDHRATAPFIHKILLESTEHVQKLSVQETKSLVEKRLKDLKDFDLEYFEIVDSDTLQSVESWDTAKSITGCVAIFAGEIRLIDNIKYQ